MNFWTSQQSKSQQMNNKPEAIEHFCRALDGNLQFTSITQNKFKNKNQIQVQVQQNGDHTKKTSSAKGCLVVSKWFLLYRTREHHGYPFPDVDEKFSAYDKKTKKRK